MRGSAKNPVSPIELYLLTSESKAVKVLLWLLTNRDKHNMIYGTLDSIALECSVTKVTVNRAFQNLYKADFLVKVRNSQYQLKKL
jgi:predicted transcriptional regulator